MSAIDLDAVEALCAAATEGPWRCGFSDDSGAPDDREGGWIVLDSDEVVVRGGNDDWQVPVGVLAQADWHFIAAARTLVPQLVARVRELEAAASVGPDDATCDAVIDGLNDVACDKGAGYGLPVIRYRTELRAAIRAALKGK